MAQYQTEEPTVAQMEELKVLVADELTKYASSMLLTQYGLPATKALDANAGLLLAMKKQVTTQLVPNACLTAWMFGLQNASKEQGADAVKFLLYDVDSSDELNQEKQAYIDASALSVWRKTFHSSLKSWLTMKKIADAGSAEYAKVKPHKVISCHEVFSDPRFNIDVLKVEVQSTSNTLKALAMVKSCILVKKQQPSSKHKMKQLISPYIYLQVCQLNSSKNASICPRIRRKLQRSSLRPCNMGWIS